MGDYSVRDYRILKDCYLSLEDPSLADHYVSEALNLVWESLPEADRKWQMSPTEAWDERLARYEVGGSSAGRTLQEQDFAEEISKVGGN